MNLNYLKSSKLTLLVFCLLSIVFSTDIYAQSKPIVGGSSHSLALCESGKIYAWGRNKSALGGGQTILGIDPDKSSLYNDSIIYTPQPVKMDFVCKQISSITGDFNLALSSKSIVYAWGDNSGKQCGQADGSEAFISYPTPVLKGETKGYTLDGTEGGAYLGGIKYLASSTYAAIAFTYDNKAVCWGSFSMIGAPEPQVHNLPWYVRDENDNIIENVIDIAAGDDAVFLVVAESGKSSGTLYQLGNVYHTIYAEFPTKVLNNQGQVLNNIIKVIAGDVAVYAVDENRNVWAYGNGGWCGVTGTEYMGTQDANARIVIAGEYESISGNKALSNIADISAGRGHAAAVTKDGYLLYWGCNDKDGGLIPNPESAEDFSKTPTFAYYCKPGSLTEKGDIVKDAVMISRGDLFDFMINDKNECYVWGMNDLGQCGTGSKTISEYRCLTKLESIPCDLAKITPTAFLLDVEKCVDDEVLLDCGFLYPSENKDLYYFEWYLNGNILNESSLQYAEGLPIVDNSYLNKPSIFVKEEGVYTVVVRQMGSPYYAKASCNVKKYQLPIDAIDNEVTTIENPLSLKESDELIFNGKVNSEYFPSDVVANFQVYTSKNIDTSVGEVSAKPSEDVKVNIAGNMIEASEIQNDCDNSGLISYRIWLENNTKLSTSLLDNAEFTFDGTFLDNALVIETKDDVELNSFQFMARGYLAGTITAKPVIYKITLSGDGISSTVVAFWKGSEQQFSLTTVKETYTVNCEVALPANHRDYYAIAMEIEETVFSIFEQRVETNAIHSRVSMLKNPVKDEKNCGISAVGVAMITNGQVISDNNNIYSNIIFSKHLGHSCNRIPLTCHAKCDKDPYVGVQSLPDNQISLQVYPNPSTSFVSIEGDEVVKGNKILVYDEVGKLVLKKEISNGGKESLDLSSLHAGTYFLMVNHLVKMIIKQ
jgi:alpha-tubulin suppressor-like RCC1 family protein